VRRDPRRRGAGRSHGAGEACKDAPPRVGCRPANRVKYLAKRRDASPTCHRSGRSLAARRHLSAPAAFWSARVPAMGAAVASSRRSSAGPSPRAGRSRRSPSPSKGRVPGGRGVLRAPRSASAPTREAALPRALAATDSARGCWPTCPPPRAAFPSTEDGRS